MSEAQVTREELEGKGVTESASETTHQVLPGDTNPLGSAFGGTVMGWIDLAGAVSAMRHARSIVVTASIDEVHFLEPVRLGDMVVLKACVNYTGRTSMEVGVRVEAENPVTGKRVHTSTAYLTFVAIDDQGHPRPIPPILPKTDEEKRRHRDACKRREHRLQVRKARQK